MKKLKLYCQPFCMIMFLTLMVTISTAIAKTLILPLLGPGEKRELTSFENIDISGAFNVLLIQGSVENVMVEATPETAGKIITKVENGTLKIYVDKHAKLNEKVSLVINFKNLKEIDCSGANVINSSGVLKLTDFSFDASGACKANLEFTATNLDIDMSGAVNAVMKGTASAVNVDISGAGKLTAGDLVAEAYVIDISGTGNAEVNATKNLNVEVSGTGNVKYKGDPKITKEVSGTGNVTKIQ